jgi:hypothetical protein
MAALAEQYIRPFLLGRRMIQAKVSLMNLSEFIAEQRKVVQEERLAAHIEVCKMEISHLVEVHVSKCSFTSLEYASLLLSGRCDYEGLINSIISNMNIDNLSKSVNEWLFTEMEDYFDTSISSQEDFKIHTKKLLPPVYINQVLQEYINSLRVTRAMGQGVNKICQESLSQMDLPWLVKQVTDKIEFGSILMGAFDCHPEEQKKRLVQQMISCISGIINHIKIQVRKQFHEKLVQTFYQFYDEYNKQDLKLLLMSRQKRTKKKWIKRREQDYMYKVSEAV